MITGEVKIINFEHLLSQFQKLPDKMLRALETELVVGANEIRNRIINSMDTTPKTGRRYPRWGGRKFHIASSPGNPPAVDTGDLKKSITMDARLPGEVEVGSTIKKPPYPVYLEEGTTRMKKRPWLQPPVDAVTARIEENIKQRILKAL